MNTTFITQLVLGMLLLFQVYNYGNDIIVNRKRLNDGNRSPAVTGLIGFTTNFFDTLGIGSYAPTTMLPKLTKSLKNDKLLPGTLNVGCAIPVMTEAFMYIKTVEVDGTTLLSMVFANVGVIYWRKSCCSIRRKENSGCYGECSGYYCNLNDPFSYGCHNEIGSS